MLDQDGQNNNNIVMFDVVVVSILKLAEDGFHKRDEGYVIYVKKKEFELFLL